MNKFILATWTLSVWFMFEVVFEAIFEGTLHWPQAVFSVVTAFLLLLFAISEMERWINKKEGE